MKKSNCGAWCPHCDTNNIEYTVLNGNFVYTCLNCNEVMSGRDIKTTGPNKTYTINKKEAEIIVDCIDFHIEGCMLDQEGNKEYIDKASAIRNKLAEKKLKSVVIRVDLEIKTPYTTEAGAEEYASNYELPPGYVEDSFDLVKIINTNEE